MMFKEIRQIASKIPQGKVTTYGSIADFLGISNARLVGYAMAGNRDSKVPCHRVVKKDGFLAGTYAFGGWQEQKKRLKREGVSFISERQLNLEKHYWLPK